MISRLEAFNYRCFDRLDIKLGQYHVLAGANGTGKSTLQDIPLLLGEILSRGLAPAFLESPSIAGSPTQSLQELVHYRRGNAPSGKSKVKSQKSKVGTPPVAFRLVSLKPCVQMQLICLG